MLSNAISRRFLQYSSEYSSGNPFSLITSRKEGERVRVSIHAHSIREQRIHTRGKAVAGEDSQSLHSLPAGAQQNPKVARRLGPLVKEGDVFQGGEPFRHKHVEEVPL